jgi:hypothetical protein
MLLPMWPSACIFGVIQSFGDLPEVPDLAEG